MISLEGKQLTSDTYYKCFSNSIFIIKIIFTYVDEFPRVFWYMTIQYINKNHLCDYIYLFSHSAVLQSKNNFFEIIKPINYFQLHIYRFFTTSQIHIQQYKSTFSSTNPYSAVQLCF